MTVLSFQQALSNSSLRSEVITLLNRYWEHNEDEIEKLPIIETSIIPDSLPPKLVLVKLPPWAFDCGINGELLIPAEWENTWDKVPWLQVIYWMVHAYPERCWENQYGCIDSYSIRLRQWDDRLWQHAWVNRIALFLRRWAAHEKNIDENLLFGSLPKPELILTHDVDAIQKTFVIRIKQAAFNCFNTIRLMKKGEIKAAFAKLGNAFRFLLSKDDYMNIPYLLELEKSYNVRSVFHFYAGETGLKRSLKAMLIDPGYNIQCKKLGTLLNTIQNGGWEIGLHPSAFTWKKPEGIHQQKKKLEETINVPVTKLRQHWLRFSWQKTWEAQEQAGMKQDSTLGFNDRCGFRNSAALRLPVQSSASLFESVPMFLMDSHLYDYANIKHEERIHIIQRWLKELYEVSGVGSIIWHTHVLGKDYGWAPGYIALLENWRTLNAQR